MHRVYCIGIACKLISTDFEIYCKCFLLLLLPLENVQNPTSSSMSESIGIQQSNENENMLKSFALSVSRVQSSQSIDISRCNWIWHFTMTAKNAKRVLNIATIPIRMVQNVIQLELSAANLRPKNTAISHRIESIYMLRTAARHLTLN